MATQINIPRVKQQAQQSQSGGIGQLLQLGGAIAGGFTGGPGGALAGASAGASLGGVLGNALSPVQS